MIGKGTPLIVFEQGQIIAFCRNFFWGASEHIEELVKGKQEHSHVKLQMIESLVWLINLE